MGPICQIAWSLGSVHIIRNMGWGGQIYYNITVWVGIRKGLNSFSASNEEKRSMIHVFFLVPKLSVLSQLWANVNYVFLGGYSKVITILNRGGLPILSKYYIGVEESLGTPNLFYIIKRQPLIFIEDILGNLSKTF